jgi:transcriptional regulator NrdR family protein
MKETLDQHLYEDLVLINQGKDVHAYIRHSRYGAFPNLGARHLIEMYNRGYVKFHLTDEGKEHLEKLNKHYAVDEKKLLSSFKIRRIENVSSVRYSFNTSEGTFGFSISVIPNEDTKTMYDLFYLYANGSIRKAQAIKEVVKKHLKIFIKEIMKNKKFKEDVVEMITTATDEGVITLLKQLAKEAG